MLRSSCPRVLRRSTKERIMFEGLFQPTHLILVLAIALIVFGPGKLPDLGKALGESIRELKKALNEGTSPPKEPSKPAAASEQPAQEKPRQQT
jgi:sec-independent protein translocase protein TatA